MDNPLLEVKNLITEFNTDRGRIKAVDKVSFSINKGEVLGLVGESGSGKSVSSLSIMRLIPNPPGKISNGQVLFKGEDLLDKSKENMRHIRGNEISMIFQEPMTSLNPVYTIGNQIAEAYTSHSNKKVADNNQAVLEMLDVVGIPSAAKRVNDYPHQFSGGMRQRVMIAIALACKPELLIADEPTTALDVTIQAQILRLMRDINEESNTSILLITHDLGVVADMCHRVCVMYAGRIMEEADVLTIFERPRHPYTKALLNSIPTLEGDDKVLESIKGNPPDPFNLPVGCKFSPRCTISDAKCNNMEPVLVEVAPNHRVRCLYAFKHGNRGDN
ncbi:ABC transporter ATP-binding protein [Metallumcola ferriviriculae]|uniref:ABC transporter ATP-binding protein n=1 Tax=Metallumcola ferriviriculae TaxID=3039180 RepID=A0AAU0UQZ7_9FIRM|nr:ABC transporter ATP-binding protein [Desulfitibacteraceae bacterium MK1]